MSDEQLAIDEAREHLRLMEVEVTEKRREVFRIRNSRDKANADAAQAEEALAEAEGVLHEAQAARYLSEATDEQVAQAEAGFESAKQRLSVLTGAIPALESRIAKAETEEIAAERVRNVAMSALANLHLEPALKRLHWHAEAIAELLPLVVRLEAGARFNAEAKTGEGQSQFTGVRAILDQARIRNLIYSPNRIPKWTAAELGNLEL